MNACPESTIVSVAKNPATGVGHPAACLLALGLILLLPAAAQADQDSKLPGTPAELLRENAALTERLRALEEQQAIAERLDAQAARLAALAERLDARLDEANAAEIPLNEDRLQATQRQLAATEARLQELAADNAKLEARLKQQQLTVDEALLRADKAEKLHAGLEEAHARVRTENERLSLELATARERQAEAMQRVLELDQRLEAVTARAVPVAPVQVDETPAVVSGETPPRDAVGTPDTGASAGADAMEGRGEPATDAAASAAPPASSSPKVVYEVRAEDTLSRIAAKVYGDASAWHRIFEANRDVLDGPDQLRLGMRLIIP